MAVWDEIVHSRGLYPLSMDSSTVNFTTCSEPRKVSFLIDLSKNSHIINKDAM